MRTPAILTALLFIAAPLRVEESSQWLFTGTAATDYGPADTWLDRESVKKSGNVVLFWAKHVPPKKIALGGGRVDMFQTLYTGDCVTRLFSAVTVIGYLGGEPVETVDLARRNKLISPPPASAYELLVESACAVGDLLQPKEDGF